MPVRILTIVFDPAQGTFDDEPLVRFMVNKRMQRFDPAFFQHEGRPYWTVLLEYENLLPEEEKRPTGRDLPPERAALLEKLRLWRREKAEREGVPAFVVATNSHLEQVVLKGPCTLEALRQISGFGKKKVDRHGKEIVDLVTAFLTPEQPPPPLEAQPAPEAEPPAPETPPPDTPFRAP